MTTYAPLNIQKTNPAAYEQASYRFRNDDGSETTATWTADANTVVRKRVGQLFRLRFLVKQTNASALSNLTPNFKLKYSVGTDAYTDVAAQAATTAAVRFANSSNITDAVATTSQVGAGTFVAGLVKENNTLSDITFTSSAATETELEFVLELYNLSTRPKYAPIYFKLFHSDESELGTYTNVPTILRARSFYIR